MNCTAEVHQDRCDIWVGTQYQSNDRTLAAKTLGMDESQVTIHRTLMGGTFGRRASKTADFVVEAVQAAMARLDPCKSSGQGGRHSTRRSLSAAICSSPQRMCGRGGFPWPGVSAQWVNPSCKTPSTTPLTWCEEWTFTLDGCLQAPFGVFPYGTSYQIPHHRIESHNLPKVGVYPHEWRAVGTPIPVSPMSAF